MKKILLLCFIVFTSCMEKAVLTELNLSNSDERYNKHFIAKVLNDNDTTKYYNIFTNIHSLNEGDTIIINEYLPHLKSGDTLIFFEDCCCQIQYHFSKNFIN